VEMEEEDVTDEDVEVIVVVVDDEDELGADFTVIGVAVPGGRPRFLAGCRALVESSAFLLLFMIPGLEEAGAGLLLLTFSPFSAPDLEVCEVVSSSEELEELSESELSESELLDSILLTFFFT